MDISKEAAVALLGFGAALIFGYDDDYEDDYFEYDNMGNLASVAKPPPSREAYIYLSKGLTENDDL